MVWSSTKILLLFLETFNCFMMWRYQNIIGTAATGTCCWLAENVIYEQLRSWKEEHVKGGCTFIYELCPMELNDRLIGWFWWWLLNGLDFGQYNSAEAILVTHTLIHTRITRQLGKSLWTGRLEGLSLLHCTIMKRWGSLKNLWRLPARINQSPVCSPSDSMKAFS